MTLILNVTFTEEATRQLGALIRELGEPAPALRVAVTGHCGCGNIHVGLAWDRNPRPDDLLLDLGDFRVVVDPMSAPHLEAATIDYRSDPFESGFTVRVGGGGGCGCGH